IRVRRKPWLRLDDGDRSIGQYEKTCCSFFTLRLGNAPLAVFSKISPTHGDQFLSALCREECQTNEGAESAVGFCHTPHLADLVIVENAGTGSRLWIGAPHALHDWRGVIFVASSVPITNHANDGQRKVSGNGTIRVFDRVEKFGYVVATNGSEIAPVPCRNELTVETRPKVGRTD